MSFNSQKFENIYQLNAAYVEDMFAKFQYNPASVTAEWRSYFSGFFDGCKVGGGRPVIDASQINFELSVAKLVNAYKSFGHLKAALNPLQEEAPEARKSQEEIDEIFDLSAYGLSEGDLSKSTFAGKLFDLPESVSLSLLIQKLELCFCNTVAVEFEHVSSPVERAWLYTEYFSINEELISIETKKQIFSELARADALEKTLATKYIGKKRFGIEGADSQIVAAESYMDELARLGAQEFRIGIAHRGRLNFLVNVIGKPFTQLLAEFEGDVADNFVGDGDVKYHNGFESKRKTRSGAEINIGLPFNPSHLEYINPTLLGEARAIQSKYYNSDTSKMAPLLFHGDAAISGQGVVYETAQLMSLKGYEVGGSVHVVANNQIGFTTNPIDGRSSAYCTDVAYVTKSPVLHVNSDDLLAVHRVMILAARYRAEFKKDIYIDLLCFRRFGHNEGDEPTFTQPALYKKIKEKPAPYETYLKYLVSQKTCTEEDLKKIYQSYRTEMTAEYEKVKKNEIKIEQFVPDRAQSKLKSAFESDILEPTNTKVNLKTLQNIAQKMFTYPDSFKINSKLERLMIQERKAMMEGKKLLDWGMAELLAYASLIEEGHPLRLVGEDTKRGTFSHRHAVLVDTENSKELSLLSAVNSSVQVEVINTLLSEEATMGYEYGYATAAVDSLVLWEGQFGDFVNGAQIYIDQFIAAGETKWRQQQGLVLLLPHGMEGQGSEHSSARMERFLQLCAQGNMQVCCLTQASQIFHVLRRQLKRDFRKPLIIMTPKSFLRSQRIAIGLETLAESEFQEILDEQRTLVASAVERVLICTGKIALDIFEAFETDEFKSFASKTAVIRIEQLYPLHIKKLESALKKYKKAKMFGWVQEEPNNMGAYQHIRADLENSIQNSTLQKKLYYFGRSRRATPAVGFEKLHAIEQTAIVRAALTEKDSIFV